MSRNFLACDIEIAKEFPDNMSDWKSNRPLGISCAATLTSDKSELTLWHGMTSENSPSSKMSKQDAIRLVEYLEDMTDRGYTTLTWNGLGFDYDILAEESGETQKCKDLARNHVDMMFHLLCVQGYPLSLANASKGMGLSGKLEGMNGALAPALWAEGNHQRVLDYVTQDVSLTLELAQKCEKVGSLSWVTRRGSTSQVRLPDGWLTVGEAEQLPNPDTSWMSDPLSRNGFTDWLR